MRIVIMVACLLCAGPAMAQDDADPMEKLLSEQDPNRCIRFYHNAGLLVPHYYSDGHLDSLHLTLDYLEDQCGKSQVIRLIRILLQIEDGSFSEMSYDEGLVASLADWFAAPWGVEPWLYYFHVPAAEGRDGMSGLGLFQYDLAIKLEGQIDKNSTAYLMCRLIEGDSDYFFIHVRSPVFAGTKMQRYYLKEVARLEEAYKGMWGHVALYTGAWLPPSKASSTIGPKVLLGGVLGFMKGRSSVDGVMAFRFFNARHGYLVDNGGNLRSTSRFMGLYLGTEYGFRVATLGLLESELVGGFGYDGINTGVPDGDEHSDYINSVNFNVGARLRFFADRYHGRYLGLSARYHFVDYGNGAGTDLSGNTITIRLILGWMQNGRFQGRAKRLHYFDDNYPRLPASDGIAMR